MRTPGPSPDAPHILARSISAVWPTRSGAAPASRSGLPLLRNALYDVRWNRHSTRCGLHRSVRTTSGGLSRAPENGALEPTPGEAAKLSSAMPVLIYRQTAGRVRGQGHRFARGGYRAASRSILLISRPALRLLSAAELQAVVAHELGHEYCGPEFEHLPATVATHGRGRSSNSLRCDRHLDPAGTSPDPARLMSRCAS